MSRKSRALAKEKRLGKKRNEKAAKMALYESFRKSGQNSKSKRAQRNKIVEKKVGKPKHKTTNCGNAGCLKCNEINFSPWLIKGKAVNMPSWLFKIWSKENGHHRQ